MKYLLSIFIILIFFSCEKIENKKIPKILQNTAWSKFSTSQYLSRFSFDKNTMTFYSSNGDKIWSKKIVEVQQNSYEFPMSFTFETKNETFEYTLINSDSLRDDISNSIYIAFK